MKNLQRVPTINANDEFVVIVRWHAPEGGRVEKGAPLVDVETTKAVVTVEADHAGWVRRGADEGAELALGALLAEIFTDEAELAGSVAPIAGPSAGPASIEGERTAGGRQAPGAGSAEGGDAPAAAEHSAPHPVPASPDVPADFSLTRLSPQAQTLAAAAGLDPAALAAARLGLVTRGELEARLAPETPVPASSPGAEGGLRREREPASKRAEILALREGSGEHLKSSLTVRFDSAAIRLRFGPDTGLLPLILAQLAPLLAEHPRFTAFHDHGHAVFYDAVHLGVAIDLGQGLRVVTLRDADRLDAAAIQGRLEELTLDYIENILTPASVQGSTFTVTDLSSYDILQFEPLINGRQSAILAIGGDSTAPGHPMSLTLAFDHRVLTGREVAAFLKSLRERILGLAPAAAPTALGAAGAESPPAAAPCCDRCLVDLASYYREMHREAVMYQYLRPDGTSGLICHACAQFF